MHVKGEVMEFHPIGVCRCDRGCQRYNDPNSDLEENMHLYRLNALVLLLFFLLTVRFEIIAPRLQAAVSHSCRPLPNP